MNPRISIRIDRIVTDRTDLDLDALKDALHQEVLTQYARGAFNGTQTSRNLASAHGQLNGDTGPIASQIASSAIKAVTS
jgi:hypothetical protein